MAAARTRHLSGSRVAVPDLVDTGNHPGQRRAGGDLAAGVPARRSWGGELAAGLAAACARVLAGHGARVITVTAALDQELDRAGLAARIMIDCSHANSQKQHERQVEVARDVAGQIGRGDNRIVGVMLESHIHPGRQDLVPGQALEYGVSITDACIGWDDTVGVLRELADAVRRRRVLLTDAS